MIQTKLFLDLYLFLDTLAKSFFSCS